MRLAPVMILCGLTCAAAAGTAEGTFYLKVTNSYLGPFRSPEASLVPVAECPFLDHLKTNGYTAVTLRRTGAGLFEFPFSYMRTNACLMVDSGAGNNLIYRSFAEALNLNTVRTKSNIGLIDMANFERKIILESGLRYSIGQRFIVRPDRPSATNQVPYVVPDRWKSFGILGAGFLKQHRAIMDYTSETLFLNSARQRRSNRSGLSRQAMEADAYTPIPLTWNSKMQKWSVSGRLNGTPVIFLVDTGAGMTCIDRPLASRIVFSGVKTESALTGETHRQDAKATRVAVTELQLGSVETRLSHAYITPPGGHNTAGALIGADVFVMHNAVLDFGANVLYLRSADKHVKKSR